MNFRLKTTNNNTKEKLARRIFALGGIFAVLYGILLSRAVFFHLKDNSNIEKIAMRQYRTAIKKSTERGKILDAAGRELAINVPSESVYADPRFVKDPEYIAKKLSAILSLDYKKVFDQLSSKRKFVWLKRKITSSEAEAVSAGKFSGILLMNESGRSYPNGELASPVLGMVGVDSEGLSGIELQHNSMLVVNTEDDAYKRDARGHIYLSPSSNDGEQKKPPHIELTIDKTVQYIAERELASAMVSTRAKNGIVIVFDTLNGDILAMANSPSFDPNFYDKYSASEWKNRAVTDVYEPGSTFKAVIISSALDKKIVGENDIFDCGGGKLKVGNNIVNDAHPHNKLSVADIVKVSSNIGAAQIAKKVGKEKIYNTIRSFGFGETSGIDLPGESGGILSPSKTWSDLQFVTIAFGQGIGATPLQMTAAFGAIVNGGELLKPHVVKRIIGHSGDVIYERKKEVREQVLGSETSGLMRKLLGRVVEQGGTGMLAVSSEYLVGGKTGTAQKASPKGGYMQNKYYSSFIGFAPLDSPRVVVYVGIDEPQGYYYGGQVAAPVFRNVAEETLRYQNVPTNRNGAEVTYAKMDSDTNTSSLIEGPAFFPSEQTSLDPIDDDVSGNQLVLTKAAITGKPFANEALPAPDSNLRIESVGENMWRVPDFSGLTMKGVLKAVGGAPVKLNFVGSGVVFRQQPLAGSVVPSGSECKLEFKRLL